MAGKRFAVYISAFDYVCLRRRREVLLTSFINCGLFEQGLDTDSPYLQLDKAIFKGEYTESFGSDMIFAKTASSGKGEGTADSKTLLYWRS